MKISWRGAWKASLVVVLILFLVVALTVALDRMAKIVPFILFSGIVAFLFWSFYEQFK